MRRKDKEVSDLQKIRDIILSCDCCRLGFSSGRGVYIVPLNFGYTEIGERRIFYFHGAKEGRKIDLIRRNGYAGFELDTKHRLNRDKIPCEFSFSFQSVIGEGPVTIVEEPEEKRAALRLIMEHYSQTDDWSFSDEALAPVAVFRLEVKEMSCKESL